MKWKSELSIFEHIRKKTFLPSSAGAPRWHWTRGGGGRGSGRDDKEELTGVQYCEMKRGFCGRK